MSDGKVIIVLVSILVSLAFVVLLAFAVGVADAVDDMKSVDGSVDGHSIQKVESNNIDVYLIDGHEYIVYMNQSIIHSASCPVENKEK